MYFGVYTFGYLSYASSAETASATQELLKKVNADQNIASASSIKSSESTHLRLVEIRDVLTNISKQQATSDQGEHPELVGGGLRRSQQESVDAKDQSELYNSRILGNGEFVEQVLRHNYRKWSLKCVLF